MCRYNENSATCACIAGGLIGALVGLKVIPSTLLNKLLNCTLKITDFGFPRPQFLSIGRFLLQRIHLLIGTIPYHNFKIV